MPYNIAYVGRARLSPRPHPSIHSLTFGRDSMVSDNFYPQPGETCDWREKDGLL